MKTNKSNESISESTLKVTPQTDQLSVARLKDIERQALNYLYYELFKQSSGTVGLMRSAFDQKSAS